MRRPNFKLVALPALAALLAALAPGTNPARAGDLQRTMESRWRGAWALIAIDTYSDCSGFHTDNQVSGTLVNSKGRFRFRPGESTLLDLGSANGTFVNDQRVRSQTTVNHGDLIRVGEFNFVLELTGGTGLDWGHAVAADHTQCRQAQRAISNGVDLRGYMHWSLLDNYEWGSYQPRFGLFGVARDEHLRRLRSDSMGEDAAGAYRRIVSAFRSGEGVAGALR